LVESALVCLPGVSVMGHREMQAPTGAGCWRVPAGAHGKESEFAT